MTWQRTLAALALLLGLAAPVGAEVTATIEPRIVDEFDAARLTIRVTGTSQAMNLNLTALEADFEVLTTQSSSQYRSVNGRVESSVEYQIMLRPRSSGELTVPSIRVGGEATAELRLQVRGMEPELREAIERMVFFESELTANPVYVQAQTVLIRRLYYSSGAQIYSDLPGLPDIPNAIVMPLGETTSTTTIRDGQRYGVIEQRFAVLPEQSGRLTIPAISVTSSVRLQSGGRTRRSGVRVATEPLTVEVLPIPPEYPAAHPWLPAEQVEVSDAWSPDTGRVAVGDPLRRTVTARVDGNVSSAIPPLQPAMPDSHFRRYPEPPELDDDTGTGRVRGTRREAYAIIPTAPGEAALPATEVVWWDVTAERVRTARAAGRTLEITGTAVARSEEAASPAQAEVRAPADERAGEAEEPPMAATRDWRSVATTLLAVLLAAGAVAGWRRLSAGRMAAAASVVGRGFALPQRRLRARRRALRAACRGDDPAAIQHALLDFLEAHYRCRWPEAARRFRADGHGAVLDTLNADRYRPGTHPGAPGNEVMRAVRGLGARTRQRREPLPALYD